MWLNRFLLGIGTALLLAVAGPAFGQETPTAPATAATPEDQPPGSGTPPGPGISLELNKLEPAGTACQAYFVVENRQADHVGELQADVFLFNKEGVVLRSLELPFADIAPGRTVVTAFELADLPCGNIGRVLLNRVVACTNPQGAPIEGCAGRLTVTSRTEQPFTY